MSCSYGTIPLVPDVGNNRSSSRRTVLAFAMGVLATTAVICIIAGISPKSEQTSLLDFIQITDDVAPAFMRHRTLTSLDSYKSGSEFANAFLKAHNDYRASHGASPLAWDDELSAASNTYASKCVYGHDQNRGKVGENIYAAGSSQPMKTSDPSFATKSTSEWYNEIKDWNFASSKSNGGVTGHFTQVVWKASTKLGCAVASCPGMLMANSIFVVCRYSPPGNFLCPTCTPPSTYELNVGAKK